MTPATPASTDIPFDSSPAAMDKPAPLKGVERVRASAVEIFDVFKRSPEWAIILLGWIVAALLPMYWYIGEDGWWSQPDSPLFLQPFVPLAVGILLWHNRDHMLEAYRQTPRSKRRGTPLLFWLGCLIVLLGHFVHVLTFAALGLVVVAFGITLMAYGVPVFLQASRCLAFGFCFIPPPSSVVAGVSNFAGWNILKASAVIAQKLHRPVTVTLLGGATSVNLGDHLLSVSHKHASGAAFTVMCLLAISIWRREKFGPALLTLAAGALVAFVLNFLFPLLGVLMPVNPLTIHLLGVPPLLIAVLAVTITVLAKKRMKVWQSGIVSGTRALEKLSEQAQKATDRATAGVAASVGGGTRRAGRSVTKGTENVMDAIGRFFAKPFKRKRKNRW